MKKLISLFLIIVLSVLFVIPVSAATNTYKMDELGLEVSFPSDFTVITEDISSSDPIFDRLGTTKSALISQFKSGNIYMNAIPNNSSTEEIVVTMTDGVFDNLSVFSDVEELKLCFHAKAYKATLIMAGSVLEAVLLDWLSDIHQKNYFKEDFMVTKVNNKGEEYQVRGNLVNYIEAIKHIEAPDWMDGADWSDAIRRKRNLVHAKLGIKTKDINKESCEMVIGYLEKVIQTRAERM